METEFSFCFEIFEICNENADTEHSYMQKHT